MPGDACSQNRHLSGLGGAANETKAAFLFRKEGVYPRCIQEYQDLGYSHKFINIQEVIE